MPIMPNFANLSQFSLKIIFSIHLLLVTWSLQGDWCPKSVLFYNFFFFTCILWAVHDVESDEPIQFALVVNMLSVFLDVITLVTYHPMETYSSSNKLSVAFMIINLIVRPITSLHLLRVGQGRSGFLATLFNPTGSVMDRQDYEDISHPVPQNSDFAEI